MDITRHQSAAARVSEALCRADAANAVGVFAARFDGDALRTAGAIDSLNSAACGPKLSGIPITVKHNLDVAGHITHAGSPARSGVAPASRDADVVDRLRRCGYIVLGHTNMTELAFSGLGINPNFGTPRNPAFGSDAHIPGGSSAGAAVSVALGITHVAIGTDTGGSVRIPAAMCGVTGFKPTAAAISRRGVIPLSPTLDAVGVIARSVADCATLFDIIRDHPQRDGRPPIDLRGLRLGALQGVVLSNLDHRVAVAYDAALDRLSAAGAVVRPHDISALAELGDINRNGTFSAAEAHQHFGGMIKVHGDVMDPMVLQRIIAGAAMSAVDYIALLNHRRRLVAIGRAQAADFDALVMPTIPIVAPRFAELTDPEHYHRINLLVLRNPSIVNFLDGCAISLPCHAPGTQPVGLTLFQAGGKDDALLRVAVAVELAMARAA